MPSTRILRRLTAIGSGLGALVLALAVTPATASTPHAIRHRAIPVTHVIEIMLENHTFDDLFGNFPGANGIPVGTTFANPASPGISTNRVASLVAPANEGDVQGGLNNSRSAELTMMDRRSGGGYGMDGYTLFPGEGVSSITTFSPETDPNLQYLARRFELADENFQPAIAPTLPNVLYALAATSHGNLTNTVPVSGPAWSTIFDELSAAHRTWRIYPGVPSAVFRGTVWTKLLPSGSTTNLTSTSQFFTDIVRGELPDFSFVRPGVGYSEEPPEDVGEGDAWLGQLVSAVAHSRYWRSTAIFVTYDEGGGFYDHASPPVVRSSFGYGTRTPMVIVSPWVRSGIDAAETTNVSVLAFLQHLFVLAPLNALDARQNDLFGAFNFHRHPLAPPKLPVLPAETIGFYGSSTLADIGTPAPGQPLTIDLQQNTPGLALDTGATGHVTLTLTPPPGVPAPPDFPSGLELVAGKGRLTITFPHPGYYRIYASGPDASLGWVTVDVGVDANTP